MSGAGPDPSTRHEPAARVAERWDRFAAGVVEGHLQANPTAAVWLGRHDLDGRLPDWSAAGLEAEVRRLRRARDEARDFPADRLDPRRVFEREHLLAAVEGELFWRERAEWPLRSPTFYAWALDPNVYLTRPYAPAEERLRAFVGWLGALPEAASRIRENLRGPLPAPFADVGRTSFAGLATYLAEDAAGAFAGAGGAAVRARLATGLEEAIAALREVDAHLAGLPRIPAERAALGEECLAEMLWATERVELPPAAVEEAGRAELERDLASLEEACGRYAPGVPVVEAIARMRARKPVGGPVAGARRHVRALRSLVLERELATIPPGPEALVAESPPYMRWNPAYIDIPGPFESALPAVFYLAPPDPAWSEEEQEAYLPGEADLLYVSAHEVWPGHYLHFLHVNRAEGLVARVFLSYAFSEGWAHYAEEMLHEAGIDAADPELRIGQAVNALLRTVRLLVSVGLHAGDLPLAEAERLFRVSAFQDPAGARQQAARGTFDPGYLNYTLGKVLIRRLREEWTWPRGGRRAWREFHDRLLSHGAPPLPLVARWMLDGAPPGGRG